MRTVDMLTVERAAHEAGRIVKVGRVGEIGTGNVKRRKTKRRTKKDKLRTHGLKSDVSPRQCKATRQSGRVFGWASGDKAIPDVD